MDKTKELKRWEDTMTPREVRWCKRQIINCATEIYWNSDYEEYAICYPSISNRRAARLWKSSQVRRFKKLRGDYGSKEWVAYRWSWRKLRFDKYLLGFNYY